MTSEESSSDVSRQVTGAHSGGQCIGSLYFVLYSRLDFGKATIVAARDICMCIIVIVTHH